MELSRLRAQELKAIARTAPVRFRQQTANLVRFLMLDEATIEGAVDQETKQDLLQQAAAIREPFLRVLLANAIVEPEEREALARLLVFGEEAAFQPHGVLEAISLITTIPQHLPALASIYPVDTRGFFLLICSYPEWDASAVLASEPLCGLGTTRKEIFARRNRDWHMQESPYAVSAVADRKNEGESHICEDDAWFTQFETSSGMVKVAATLDGPSDRDNLVNRVWQEKLKQHLQQTLREALAFEAVQQDRHALQDAIVDGIEAAQLDMKQLMFQSWDSFSVNFPTDEEMQMRKSDRSFFKTAYHQQKERGDDPDSIIKWHFLNSLAATTLELNILLPGRKGFLFRVGDGNSVLLKQDGTFQALGRYEKRSRQETNALFMFGNPRNFSQFVDYEWEEGDKVLTMTDGPGDQYADDMEALVQFFRQDDSLYRAMTAFTQAIDSAQKLKPDDFALLALRC